MIMTLTYVVKVIVLSDIQKSVLAKINLISSATGGSPYAEGRGN